MTDRQLLEAARLLAAYCRQTPVPPVVRRTAEHVHAHVTVTLEHLNDQAH